MSGQPRRILLAASSGLLLAAAYPPIGIAWLAWIALVPWLVAIADCGAGRAFRFSFLFGFVFFLLSLSWLFKVTVIGTVILCLYLALYPALAGFVFAGLAPRLRGGARALLLAALWILTEAARGWVLTGFGWNSLAASQTGLPALIQIADLGGTGLIGFILVFINAALAGIWRPQYRFSRGALALLAAGVMAWTGYGFAQLRRYAAPEGEPLRASVVQTNIPQDLKWDPAFRPRIVERLGALTAESLERDPGIILWPETSLPGFYGEDEELSAWARALVREPGALLVAGAPVVAPDRENLLNRALVFAAGEELQRYDKIHLVPFGEFVPLERWFPWLRDWLPPIGTFIPGKDYTLLGNGAVPPFAVLICFEDAFADLTGDFVRRGATWLAVMTNDAWFFRGGPLQHAQASMLRAVEYRRPVVRAANTGWSGCIAADGRATHWVKDASGRSLNVAGVAGCTIYPRRTQTVYLRWGEWFTVLCGGLVLAFAGMALRTATSDRRQATGKPEA